jgi:hypothetical protein
MNKKSTRVSIHASCKLSYHSSFQALTDDGGNSYVLGHEGLYRV